MTLKIVMAGNLYNNGHCGDVSLSFSTDKTVFGAFLFNSNDVRPYIGGEIREQDMECFIATMESLIKELKTGKTDEERCAEFCKQEKEKIRNGQK